MPRRPDHAVELAAVGVVLAIAGVLVEGTLGWVLTVTALLLCALALVELRR